MSLKSATHIALLNCITANVTEETIANIRAKSYNHKYCPKNANTAANYKLHK